MNLDQYEFTAIDIETTGLLPENDEVLEIAGIRFNKEKILGEFHIFISPKKGLKKQAQSVNGITEKMLANAPPIEEGIKEFLTFIENSVLVIQNAEFDLSFLLYQCKKNGLMFPTLPVICTLNMTRILFPKFEKHGLAALRKKFKIGNIKDQSRNEFHQALDDSYAAMQVFINCVQTANLWDKDINKLNYHPKGYKFTSDYR